MMTADQDNYNIETGSKPSDPTGFEQGWISRIRGRKVLGDNVKKGPFIRSWVINGVTTNVVGSPMSQDKVTAIADAVGWRRVNAVPANVPNMPVVVDVGDMVVICWEYFKLIANPAILVQAINNAQAFPKWPFGYPGAASFDTSGS